jgi:hypothetical protein
LRRRVVISDALALSRRVGGTELDRRGAGYVDRILRGKKPANLSVQAPTRYETAINLKTDRGAVARRRGNGKATGANKLWVWRLQLNTWANVRLGSRTAFAATLASRPVYSG